VLLTLNRLEAPNRSLPVVQCG